MSIFLYSRQCWVPRGHLSNALNYGVQLPLVKIMQNSIQAFHLMLHKSIDFLNTANSLQNLAKALKDQ